MTKIRSVSDIKFFLYISSAKLDTLFAQIASSGREKKSFEWSLDLKALKLGRKTEREALRLSKKMRKVLVRRQRRLRIIL